MLYVLQWRIVYVRVFEWYRGVYLRCHAMEINNGATWCKYVKDLLLNFSITNLWENQQNMDLNILRNFVSKFKTGNGSRFKRV